MLVVSFTVDTIHTQSTKKIKKDNTLNLWWCGILIASLMKNMALC